MNTWVRFFEYVYSNSDRLLQATQEHIVYLVFIPVGMAILMAVPLGILCTRWPRGEKIIMGLASVLQTIPGLAMLAFMITLGLGIGYRPAIVALTLYALLPILRNTYTGIIGVDSSIKEAATGMGMTNVQLLIEVEIPMAVPVILAGIRTASVISVGAGTLAALIGAGGLGQFIITGLTQIRDHIILAGAIPSALLALIIDRFLGKTEDWLTPRGLKL